MASNLDSYESEINALPLSYPLAQIFTIQTKNVEVDSNEIQLNVDEFGEVIADTIEALGLPKTYSNFFESKVLPDLNHIDCMSEKEKLRKNASALQSHIHHLMIPLKR